MTHKTKSRILWIILLACFFMAGVNIANVEGDPNVDAKPNENLEGNTVGSSIETVANNNLTDIKIQSINITENSIGEKLIKVVIKNTADKTLKNIDLGIIGYNQDGKCIKFNFGNDDIYIGSAKNIDIKVNESKEFGWNVYPDGELKKIKACIDVYGFEGEKTKGNKYFKTWKEENIKSSYN